MAAAAGRRDQAFDYLNQAVGNGYRFAGLMESESDLNPLRDDPRFAALLARARRKATPVAVSH